MTTTAQPVAGLEVGNTDAMDFLSDTGYGVREDEIDLDMRSTNENQHEEDDALSLQDAIEDGGVDLQNTSGNQDDFMVDKDDLIEDEISYSDLELEDAAQAPVGSDIDVEVVIEEHVEELDAVPNVDANVDNNEEFEEDLIDYSDDEQQEEQQEEEDTQNARASIDEKHEGSLVATNVENDQNFADDGTEPVDHSTHEEHEYEYQYQGEGVEQSSGSLEQHWNENAPANWEQPFEPGNVESTYTDDHHANDQLENFQGEQTGTESNQHTKGSKEVEDVFGARPDDETQTKSQAQQEPSIDPHSPLHPITINYDGSELWLFKPHEPEDGEWLLSDESVASQHFPYLFHACRAQLGDDINSETELGFRFDNFHALELYEDCTACAYATLKDFIDIYLQLHSQDGHSSPEPFYVTLQFRPRVLTLVNELKKAVEDQIGFSGLNSAVASGKTSFNNAFSNNHAEAFNEDWTHGEEESDEQGNFGDETAAKSVPQPYPPGSHTDVEGEGEKFDQSNTHDRATSSNAASPHTSSQDVSAPGSDGGEEFEEPLIDYSEDEEEDEDAANAAETEQTSVNGPSTGSSTVQGDDASYGHDGNEDLTNPTESREDDRHSEFGHDDSAEDDIDTHDLDNENTYVQFRDDNRGHDDYGEQEFDQDYDQSLNFGEYAAGDLPQGDNEYYYNEDDNANFDQHNEFGLAGEADDLGASTQHDETELATAEDGFDGVDDFLDLTGDDIAEDAPALPDIGTQNEENEINYDDEEGAKEQDAVAADLAAPPAVASSTGLSDYSSPQGQKRAIDEVDSGLDGASNETGSYSCYVCEHCIYANHVYSDTKRPKL